MKTTSSQPWFRFLAVGVAALSLLAAACGRTEVGGGQGGGSTISIDGSSTVFPVTQAVAEEFTAEQPDVNVSVGVSGTGGGFEKFCAGEIDAADASRPIAQEEIDACEQAGVEYVELEVAIDGLSVVVNPENDFAECLTVEELEAVWEPKSEVDTWNEVRPAFPDQELTLYGPGTDSGTFDYFTDEVVGEEGASRSDYTASEDDNVLVQGVAGDANALGYFGYAYYQENTDKLRAVGVDAGDGCVEPTDETINSGTYPLSRPLFIYVNNEAASRPVVTDFVDFYLATANELVAEVGYIPLPDERLARQKERWQSFTAKA